MALNEKGLIDSFVPDAQLLVVREVDRQAPGNLLGAPGFRPSPILARARPTVFPPNGRITSASAAWARDDTGKPVFHISAQGDVERKLGRLGAAGRSICMPLSGRRPICHPAAVGGCIAIQFTGDCRGSPSEAPPNLPQRMPLHIEKRDLLALRQPGYRPESGFAEDLKIEGGMPPAFRNNLGPTACDTPASNAASSLLAPAAIACQNLSC